MLSFVSGGRKRFCFFFFGVCEERKKEKKLQMVDELGRMESALSDAATKKETKIGPRRRKGRCLRGALERERDGDGDDKKDGEGEGSLGRERGMSEG